MEVHSTVETIMKDQLDQLKEIPKKRKLAEPFQDPIREFHRSSLVEGTVRQWLTYTPEARQGMVDAKFEYIPQSPGEKDSDFRSRELERLRALWVIIQEESRAAAGIDAKPENSSAVVAMTAFKKLFPSQIKRGA
jgi:hypothetical protein